MARVVRTLMVLVVAAVAVPGEAAASCAALPSTRQAIPDADFVFDGTVVDLTNEDRWAVVEVHEVWKGTDVPSYVQIQAGPKSGLFYSVASSGDREYVLGWRYLFFPHSRQGSVFKDDNCSATTRFRPELEDLRPDDATRPIPVDPISAGGPPWGVLAISLGVLVVAVVVGRRLLIARKDRQPESAR